MMDLPVHDDLELVLQATTLTAAAEPTADAAPVTTQLRPAPQPRAAAGAAGGTYQYAQENSVLNLETAYGALKGQMAMSFPFELDAFQKEGIVLMEAGESVFVAAHTSAGAPPARSAICVSWMTVGSSAEPCPRAARTPRGAAEAKRSVASVS